MHPPDEDDAATVSSMRAGARRALPLAVAVGGFGVSFEVLAGTAGLSPAAAIAMSLTTFAGSAQFAAVSVLGDGGAMAGAVLAAVLLNARYLPIGASVAPAMTGSPLRRFLEAQLVVDESWAIGHLGEGRFDRGRILGAGLVLYAAWTLGTVAGALGGDRLGDPETLGLDAAFPALFLALLAGQITGRRALAAALLGAVIALVLIPVAPPGVPVIAAALGCLLGLRQRTPAATEEAR